MQKDTKIAAGICTAIVGLLIITQVFTRGESNLKRGGRADAVAMENGVQVITMTAKGGYSPQYVEAKSGLPTELHVVTSGTFDCSSSLVIPSLGYSTLLEPTGTTTITIPAEQARGSLEGTCGMGMYSFTIAFK